MSNGSRVPLEEMTLRQLRLVASEYEVSRYSRMRKVELVAAIRLAQAARGEGEAAPAASVATTTTAPTDTVATDTVATDTVTTDTVTTDTVTTDTVTTDTVPTNAPMAELATVDDGLGDLPGGYGESRIVLMPRDPQWAYVYWDIPGGHKEEMRRQGGIRLAIRFYDVTDIDIDAVAPHSLQQYECDEMAREWFLPVPVSDRDYIAEIGYVAADGRWLMMARSAPIHVPPVYPSDWIEDHFMTVSWDEDLRGQTLMTLVPPSKKSAAEVNPIYDEIFAKAQSMEVQRIAGSLFGSMHQVPEQAVSSFVFPSGVGMWASGVGFSASAPPVRPRKFWLVADAELIVYGATEPDATVTIGSRKIDLKPDGTFRFQMSFQDGLIDYPIKAVAADGEQTRSMQMRFTRETPERNTNTKAEAVEEWFAF